MTRPSSERYLTAAEVGVLLGVNAKTVGCYARDGKLPFLRTLGGHRRYPEKEIRALVEVLRQQEGGANTTTT